MRLDLFFLMIRARKEQAVDEGKEQKRTDLHRPVDHFPFRARAKEGERERLEREPVTEGKTQEKDVTGYRFLSPTSVSFFFFWTSGSFPFVFFPVLPSRARRGRQRRRQYDPEKEKREKERCSGSYCQAVGFLVIKDDSISKRPG